MVAEGVGTEQWPLFAIRPHQTLRIKADSGKLGGPGSIGEGRLLVSEIVNDGAEAHFKAHRFCRGAQGNGNSWVHITDAKGQHRRLRFGYLITRN